jgi:hypothetical protein
MMPILSRWGSADIRHNIAQERQGQDVRDGCSSGAQDNSCVPAGAYRAAVHEPLIEKGCRRGIVGKRSLKQSCHRDESWPVASFRKESRDEGVMQSDRAVETVTVADGLVGSEEGDPGGKQDAEAVHAPGSVAVDISPTRWASRRSSAPGL